MKWWHLLQSCENVQLTCVENNVHIMLLSEITKSFWGLKNMEHQTIYLLGEKCVFLVVLRMCCFYTMNKKIVYNLYSKTFYAFWYNTWLRTNLPKLINLCKFAFRFSVIYKLKAHFDVSVKQKCISVKEKKEKKKNKEYLQFGLFNTDNLTFKKKYFFFLMHSCPMF